ncbi:uncharacterized protein MONBRDRAFT_25074 [Monosiga brevicollis MX1]|uniref:Cullin family profile domain-containing protein n=1 Tax=Monosiga brevicollis TaxID=81824 RepID=A9UYC2_MONBE|nr:uncharacterized protein MONBRDRAFT_25074 [Monosiga brevicollis MX1]EDQ89438.1 predicted protein [Monosiga brevicollis MX1]|eukprot:XP_001745467.1 hypothetical protein [Monosiga brevicollis MX1]
MKVWRETIYMPMSKQIIHACMIELEQHRETGNVELFNVQATLRSLTDMCTDRKNSEQHQLYIDEFETPWIKNTDDHYKALGLRLLEGEDRSAYLVRVTEILEQEEQRLRSAVPTISHEKILAVCHRCLISNHQAQLETQFQVSLERDNRKDLSACYKLLLRADCLDGITNLFQARMTAVGMQDVQALGCSAATPPNPTDFIARVVDLHAKGRELTNDCFQSSSKFSESLDRSCATIVNTSLPKRLSPAELLARGCDLALRKTKGAVEEELDSRLEDIMLIFSFLQDKDVFLKFFTKAFAKRLIHGTSVSEAMEANMIGRLKAECGFEYTLKLQRMHQDVQVSTDFLRNFRQSNMGRTLPFSFEALILRTNAWPFGSNPPAILLPPPLSDAIYKFEQFYTHAHSGRKLNWLYHVSTGDIKAKLPKGVYELSATTFQMCTLLAFNTQESFSSKDIQNRLGMSKKDADRVLQSLITCRLLIGPETNDKAADLADDEPLTLNLRFKNKKRKLKISTPLTKETQSETAQTHKAVDEDRRMVLEAIIVRIMKTRKALKYNELVQVWTLAPSDMLHSSNKSTLMTS